MTTTSVAGTTPTGTSGTTTTATTTTTTSVVNNAAQVTSLILTRSASSVPADSSSTLNIKVVAVDANNAVVPDAVINFSANGGVVLGAAALTTGANGAVSVLMTANSNDQNSRVSTVTARCGACTAAPATSQIQVVGASVALTGSTNPLVIGGATTLLTAVVKDVSGTVLPGITVTFSVTDSNILGISTATVATNASGVGTVTVSGMGVGNASVNVTALGNAKSQSYVSGFAASALTFTSPAANQIAPTSTAQAISVAAAGASSVTLSSSRGTFGNGLTTQVIPVSGGVASVMLTSSQGGTAIVSALDDLGRTSLLTIFFSPPVSAANKIILNASRTTVPLSQVNSQNSIVVTAKAVSSNGTTDQPVANVPVSFAMAGGPGAGEFLTPAIAISNSSGVATATFFAGSAASIASGITITASTSSPAVTTPSSASLLVTIGGGALSVAVGRASLLGSSGDNTLYLQAYSAQVTDSGNNPVSGAVVTLRMQPFAFATGPACTPLRTYCSEDKNGNGSLEAASEDGYRKEIGINELSYSVSACPSNGASTTVTGVTLDGLLTPQNSDGGSVPSTVTTDANGIAAFTMTYLKSSAYWVVNRLTATVSSNGTESSNTSIFRLQPTVDDVGPPCTLPASPYAF
jgi:adhesin/invasin